jgi:tetratricopeptide (TPR) repeat protein
MITTLRRSAARAVALLGAVVLLPAVASAQVAEGCSVDLFKPSQLAQATVFIQQAAQNPEGEAAAKALRDAAKLVTDDRRFADNPLGLAFLRAQIFVLWMHQDNPPIEMTIAELNLGRDRNTKVNLMHATDSLLTIVEEGAPGCEAETDKWRRSKPWNDRIGAAYRLIGENKIDSAEVYAKEAFVLDRTSPFIYNALAQIAGRRGDTEGLLTNLEKAIELASKDTALAETSRQLRTQFAGTLQEQAVAKTDAAERNAMLGRAARIFLEIGSEDPMADDGPAYFSTAMDIAMLTQDQELIREILDPMIEDPLPYPDLTLLIGAETSRMLNRADDAMALYKGALEKNPNIRDANYFLTFMLIEAKRVSETGPLLDKLLEIDPSNPDNLLMKTMAVRQVAEAEKDTKKRAELIKQVEGVMAQESSMQHRLTVTRFERDAGDGGARLTGSIENRGRAAKTYTVEVSFLDLDGNVLETLTATTESAAPGATVSFEVKGTEPGVAAWKYAPLK